jgi:GH25 family lysozyme M1 (1,4-beta-N-acetylmuramidase)
MKKQLLIISSLVIFSLPLVNGLKAQTILGTDVYHGDDPINWNSVKGAGYIYAWCKATQGTTYTDPDFVSNITSGFTAGMYMGAYDFCGAESNTATAEANYFLSVAGSYIKTCEMPPVLDLEDPSSGPTLSSSFSSAALTTWVQTWMNTVQSATGITPVLYTTRGYAAYLSSSLNGYPLWVADPDGSTTVAPSTGSWTTYAFKQYSFTATIPGLGGSSGGADADVFNGTSAQFMTLIGCSTAPVTVSYVSNVTSGCPGVTVNFTDKSTSTGTVNAWSWRFPGGNPATSNSQNPSVVYSTSGTYPVTEVVTSTTGKDSLTKTSYITIASSASLPLNQTFQSATFPPTGWTMNFPVATDSAWELATSVGYGSTQCMYFPANCGNVSNISGERQQIYTPVYNFTGVTNAEMSFDVAYEPSSTTSGDTLAVYYSTDCGSTWHNIYLKGGATLCTTGSTTGAGTDVVTETRGKCFVPPNTSAWRRDSISLSAINNQSSVMFSFESRSGWGNIIYLDNINVPSSPTSVQDISASNEVKVYPNPNSGSFSISIEGSLNEKAQIEVYNGLGQQIYNAPVKIGVTEVALDTRSSGMYFYRVMTETGKFVSDGKLMVQH